MPATEHKDYPNQVYAWYVVGVLTVAYIFSFIDRQILNPLVEPIREDLQLSDTQISLLQGIAFALFYTLMTALCGLTKTFWQLFAARIGVGVGEAGSIEAGKWGDVILQDRISI